MTDFYARPTRGELEKLVGAAMLAPSPDNNQPWLFEEQPEGGLLLCHDLTRALPSDVHFMFSMIALGAALENLCIASRQCSWEPEVNYVLRDQASRQASSSNPHMHSPQVGERQPIARIRFRYGGHSDPLYPLPLLAQRITCRKPYSRRAPPDTLLESLTQAADNSADIQVHWLKERSAIRALSPMIAASDRVRFEYRSFHQELYRQLRFSEGEAERTKDGLDIRTLEVPPGTGLLLRFLRSWKRMQIFNWLGLSLLLTLPSALAVWRSGVIGLITVAKPTPASFLQGGRSFQRLWLTATGHGLSLQPLGSLPIFLGHLELLAGQHLDERHRRRLTRIAEEFHELLPASRNRNLLIAFRLGYSVLPKVRSLRRHPSEVMNSPLSETDH
ncbi:MAG TPA: hypothetical protein VMF69_06245 [Gemmataceae bacterium]|nr:hypothetical protein [Gemmataceae bacterium]